MKSAIFLFLSTLIIAVPAWAQNESCPLKVSDVRNIDASLEVVFTNNAASAVTSYEFGLSFQDLDGKDFTLPFPLLRKESVKAGQNRTAIFPTLDSLQFLFPTATAYLLKVSFADGSDWTDDGSHACSITSLQE